MILFLLACSDANLQESSAQLDDTADLVGVDVPCGSSEWVDGTRFEGAVLPVPSTYDGASQETDLVDDHFVEIELRYDFSGDGTLQEDTVEVSIGSDAWSFFDLIHNDYTPDVTYLYSSWFTDHNIPLQGHCTVTLY